MTEPAEQDLSQRWQQRSPFDASFWALVVVGLFLVVLPFVSPLRDVLDRAIEAVRLVELVLGFALLYIAFLLKDVRSLRQRNLVLMETLLAALREGKVARKDHEAVEILLTAVESGNDTARRAAGAQLARLTGQSFGEDAAAWRRWWAANRDSFRGRVERRDEPEEGGAEEESAG